MDFNGLTWTQMTHYGLFVLISQNKILYKKKKKLDKENFQKIRQRKFKKKKHNKRKQKKGLINFFSIV